VRQFAAHEAGEEAPLERDSSSPVAAVPKLLLSLQQGAGNRAVAGLVARSALQRHCEAVDGGPLAGKDGRATLAGGNEAKIVAKVKAHWSSLEANAATHGGGGVHGAGGAAATLTVPGTGVFSGNTDSSHHAEALAVNAALNAAVAFPIVGAQMTSTIDCCYMCTVLCAALGISVPSKDSKTYPTYFIPIVMWRNAAFRQAFIGADADLMYQHLGETAQASFQSGIVGAALYSQPI
jgi:hypothetical protein